MNRTPSTQHSAPGTPGGWRRRFQVKGVFWRQFLRWAVLNIPLWIEPAVIAWWSLFFLLWGPGRRGVMRNLSAVKEGSWAITNFFRTYRVFWNYAWTITDNIRFKEQRFVPEFSFAGREHFEPLLQGHGGAIILTAHMGSYDLGAHLFAASTTRQIVMIRAPEVDPQTRQYEEAKVGDTKDDGLRVGFNTKGDLAFELLEAVQRGELVAIQGDRVTPGIATTPVTLFGRRANVPSGPFALAMAARVPIHPMFVVRTGPRRYTLITGEPITVERSGRGRDFTPAIAKWVAQLEHVIRENWFQWFAFEPFFEESA
jgi:predicted LPLAT superfamily acyltransferase